VDAEGDTSSSNTRGQREDRTPKENSRNHMRCPECKGILQRKQCGGPGQCDHGRSLRADCKECAPYEWFCSKCDWERSVDRLTEVDGLSSS